MASDPPQAKGGGMLARALARQRERWPLLFPLAMMAGAAAWMAAPQEPAVWLGAAVALIFGGLAVGLARARVQAGRVRAALAALCGLLAMAGLGAGAAELHATLAFSPRIQATQDDLVVTGFVIETTQGVARPRMLVQAAGIENLDGPLPHRVSLSTLPGAAFAPGQSVRCRAQLSPPSGPMAPHSYDGARAAYFEQVGATGFTLGRCRPGALAPPDDLLRRAEVQLAAWRRALTEAIYAASPDDGGAIAAALVTGDRSLMSQAAVLAFRDSGLAHMLSVSGLHMSLVGGGVFLALWAALAFVPNLALFAPIKKWAAVGALLALSAYLIISGANVPAVRAYIMAAAAFGAVLIDRPALSMRALGAALAVIVLISPNAVLEPGFQMSFAATGALVAWFEARRETDHVRAPVGLLVGAIQNGAAALGGVLLISLVAGLATDPFGIFHFQRFTLYGLPVNLAASPITTFVVAPAALAAAAAAPFGLSEWPLRIMADALIVMVQIAKLFADRPEAVQAVAAIPTEAFVAIVVGLMWMMVWRGGLRWLGVVGLLVGGAAWGMAPAPIAAFDGDGRVIVARVAGDSGVLGRAQAEREPVGQRESAPTFDSPAPDPKSAVNGRVGGALARFQAEWIPVGRPESAPTFDSRATYPKSTVYGRLGVALGAREGGTGLALVPWGRPSDYVTQRLAGLLGEGPEAALILPMVDGCEALAHAQRPDPRRQTPAPLGKPDPASVGEPAAELAAAVLAPTVPAEATPRAQSGAPPAAKTSAPPPAQTAAAQEPNLGVSPSPNNQPLAQPPCRWGAPNGASLAAIMDPADLAAACEGAALVFLAGRAPDQLPDACASTRVIDQTDLARSGGGLVRATERGLSIERARDWAGQRRWSGPLTRNGE